MTWLRWQERSIRSWVLLWMVVVTLPIAASVAIDYLVLKRGVIAGFREVAAQHRDRLAPVQRLRLALWEAAVPLNEYLDAHKPEELAAYRRQQVRIEAGFASLQRELSHAGFGPLLRRAQDDWRAADRLASELASVYRPPGDATAIQLADRFDVLIASSVDSLEAMDAGIEVDVERIHIAALAAYERAEWITAGAALVSLLLILGAVVGIGRIIVLNVERLVDGARKFAAGDRGHRIEVQVPPELRRVADEFNSMIRLIHQSEAALAEEARADPMTGLANRRSFNEALKDAFARMRRLDEQVILFILDVDHFKKINDTYGHPVGDEVLRSVARTLSSSIREVDKAFRIGGEEFTVLLMGTDLAGARIVAERVRSAVERRPVATDKGQVSVTASIGIARAGRAMEVDDLLKAADTALYEAKAEGRNRVMFAVQAPEDFPPVRPSAKVREMQS